MKLSAPPPPPPEPNEPPAPDAPPPDPTAATPDAPPPEKAPPKPATWPGWFGGADAAIALLAVVLAFLVASFAARNSDLWLHLGAGKKLAGGEYKLGSDPFSYTAADRAWVNHSWLADLAMYLLYSGTGFTLVLLKALVVAAAAALLVAVRKPAFPLWPWAGCAALFALASAPRLQLTPYVGSVLFLAATLYAVFRVSAKRLPVVVGVLFWFWANTDQWFVLGPVALGLLLVGEFLQDKFFTKADATGDEPLTTPPVPVLAKALAVGMVACMLNPHHVRVWELPFELVGSSVGKSDTEIFQLLLVAPTDSIYSDRATLGYNVNGLAYAVLLLAGGVALGFGVGRLRVAHLVLWLGFAVLSLLSMYAIPFFAAVAVPLIAAQLNALSVRMRLGAKASPGTRLLVLGSAGGRVFSLVGLVALCACAWPGWLHPQVFEPAAVRRVAWAVEPDPALVKAASQIQAWRAKGDLPADARGFLASMQFANYCAWFAPAERVFVNGRYNHHRPELIDYTAMRLALGLRTRDGPPDQKAAAEILSRNKAEYLGYSDPARRNGPDISFTLWAAYENWSPWYTDGRAALFGWRAGTGTAAASFEKLRLDAVAVGVGPDAGRLPAGKVSPVPRPREWEDDFTRPVKTTPPDIDEAFGWIDYRKSRGMAYNIQQDFGRELFVNTLAPQGDTFHQLSMRTAASNGWVGRVPPRGDAFAMAPILALRAARRAIASNPDHPDSYYVLAQVLQDPALPMGDAERQFAIITAYQQCLSRLPSPDEMRKQLQLYGRKLYVASPTQVSFTLAQSFLRPSRQGFLGVALDDDTIVRFAGAPLRNDKGEVTGVRFLPFDIVRALLVQASEYAAIEVVGGEEAERKNFLDGLKSFTKAVEDELRQRNDAYKREPAQGMKVAERFRRAKQLELTGEAISVMKGVRGEDLSKEFGPAMSYALLELVALELCCGRLEDAAAHLADVKDAIPDLTRALPPEAQEGLRQAVRTLDQWKMMFEGDYAGAGAELEGRFGKAIGLEPLVKQLEKENFNPKPFLTLGPAWAAVTMLAAQSPLDAYTMHLGGLVGQQSQQQKYLRVREFMAQKLQDDAAFFYRRGFLSLIEGDVPAAKERFRQSRREPPPGWNLSPVMFAPADLYLRMIEAAEKK